MMNGASAPLSDGSTFLALKIAVSLGSALRSPRLTSPGPDDRACGLIRTLRASGCRARSATTRIESNVPPDRPPLHLGDDQGRVGELALAVGGDLLVQQVDADVGRDRVVAARVHDAGAGGGRLVAELVDGEADERHLAGEVDVVGAGVGDGGQQRLAVLEVGADGRADDAGARRHGVERGGGVGVGHDERPVVRRRPAATRGSARAWPRCGRPARCGCRPGRARRGTWRSGRRRSRWLRRRRRRILGSSQSFPQTSAHSMSTTTGAWSLGLLPLRSSRSIQAELTRFASAGEASTKSMRMPRFLGKLSCL